MAAAGGKAEIDPFLRRGGKHFTKPKLIQQKEGDVVFVAIESARQDATYDG